MRSRGRHFEQCDVNDGESWSDVGDLLAAALALLVGDALAAEGTELVLHGVGNEDADGDENKEDNEDNRDGDVAFHHLGGGDPRGWCCLEG